MLIVRIQYKYIINSEATVKSPRVFNLPDKVYSDYHQLTGEFILKIKGLLKINLGFESHSAHLCT